MKIQQWLESRNLTWIDLIKISAALGFLTLAVVIMMIGAVGAIVS